MAQKNTLLFTSFRLDYKGFNARRYGLGAILITYINMNIF